MGFPGGYGCSRKQTYGGANSRTGEWVGPNPSKEPGIGESHSDKKKKKKKKKKK